jgi:peptidoglycan/xylan/chitin deacetylase (PgdA/CDA1 family)
MIAATQQAHRLGASAYYGGLRLFGLNAVRRFQQEGGLVLCYHNVVTSAEAHEGDPGLHMSIDRFERHMRWLAVNYNVVPLYEFARRAETGEPLRSVAAITFDDGYVGVFRHAVPLLEVMELPATVFVVADAPGRSDLFWWDRPDIVSSARAQTRHRRLIQLRGDESAIVSELDGPVNHQLPATHYAADWGTIRAHVGRHIDIGVHSATHRTLTTLPDDDLEREIVTSRAVLYHATGVWPHCFSYPYGVWDRRIRDAVQAAGYLAACTLETVAPRTRPADVWALPRLSIPAGISDGAFEAWTAGFRGREEP